MSYKAKITIAEILTSSGTPDSTTYLRGDGTWATPAGGGGGSGTVTSIAVAVPSWLSVSGSPVTTSGTITISAASGQTANQILATPDGTTGSVSLRALVSNDIPTLAQSKITNLTTDLAARVLTTTTISTTSPLSGGGDLSTNRTLSIADAAADGTTKGAATFAAADFNSASGVISIDYTNGQAASGSNKGFLTSSDWTNFTAAYNDKINSAALSAGTLTLTQQDGGTVTATVNTTNVTEGTNLYYTDARARASISLTTTGTSGAATYNSTTGVLNIPQYSGGGGGGSGTVTDFVFTDNTVFDGTVTNSTTTPTLSLSINDDSIDLVKLNTSGTASSSTFLRGDGAWSSISGATANKNKTEGTSGASVSNVETSIATVTITPSDTTSTIMIIARCEFTKDTGTTVRQVDLRVKRSTTQIGNDSRIGSYNVASLIFGPAVVATYDVPGVTTSTTYTLYAQTTAGTITANRYSIEVFEIPLRGEQGIQGPTGATGPAQGITVNTQSGTSYTLLASDSGKIVEFTSASAVTCTLPSGLGTTFGCTIMQSGAGQVTLAASGTTINNRNSYTKTAGQHASFSILPTGTTNTYKTQGDMTT